MVDDSKRCFSGAFRKKNITEINDNMDKCIEDHFIEREKLLKEPLKRLESMTGKIPHFKIIDK